MCSSLRARFVRVCSGFGDTVSRFGGWARLGRPGDPTKFELSILVRSLGSSGEQLWRAAESVVHVPPRGKRKISSFIFEDIKIDSFSVHLFLLRLAGTSCSKPHPITSLCVGLKKQQTGPPPCCGPPLRQKAFYILIQHGHGHEDGRTPINFN